MMVLTSILSGDRELMSATRFIGMFKPKFETQRIAEEYAAKRGLRS